jgi:EmrB/QacA subfamily drug resistance transporter
MRKWLPLVAICAGTFMLLIDVTIVTVALPSLAGSLHTSFGSLQWVVDGYALTLAALVLGAGSLADRVGHRRVFIAGLIIFGAASLACGFATGPALLIGARAVQGAGGAAMFATSFPLLNGSYAGRDRGTAYGVWGAVAGASAALGPVLGGLLTQELSWRWIFFVNPPVSVGVIALAWILADMHRPAPGRVDVPGILLLTAAAAAATYGFIRAGSDGWAAGGTWGMLAAAAVLVAAFALVEWRTAEPMLDVRLLRHRVFTGMLLAGLGLNFAAFAYLTYASIWLQSVLRMSPVHAGLVSTPLSLTAFIVAGWSGRGLHGARPGRVIGAGLTLIGLGGLVGVVLVRGAAGWPDLLPGYVVAGFGVGLVSPMLGSSTMASVPRERAGMAAGAVNMMRQLGYAFGIALLGTVFAARAAATIADRGVPDSAGLARALAGGQARQVVHAAGSKAGTVGAALHAASLSGLQGAFGVAGLAGLAVGLAVFLLVRQHQPDLAQPSASPSRTAAGGAVSGPARSRSTAVLSDRVLVGDADHVGAGEPAFLHLVEGSEHIDVERAVDDGAGAPVIGRGDRQVDGPALARLDREQRVEGAR